MDILGLGDLALDLFTGLGLAKPDRAAGPGAKAAPEQEREPSPRLGALVVVGVASLAILAVAVSFLFSEAGRDFFASMGGTGNLAVGERLMHVLGGLDLLGWLVLAAFLLPLVTLPTAIAAIPGRATRLAVVLIGVLTLFAVALAAAVSLGIAA